MFSLDKHERLRRNLSAYADGELSSSDAARVEAHLATCDACGAVLDGLRITSAALRGLPTEEATRSFALTPDMAAAPSPTPSQRPAPIYATGLRFAAAGLAVALAVVMVADRSNFGGEGDSGGSHVQGLDGRQSETLGATEERAADYDAATGGQPDSAAGAPQATGVPGTPPEAPSEDVQTRASEAPQLADGDTDDKNDLDAGLDSETAGGETASETATDSSEVDVLTVVELVLAALLVATIIGLGAVWLIQRSRAT